MNCDANYINLQKIKLLFMIHAKQTQLVEAFKKHSKAGDGDEKSHGLLKFYAAECGLKAYLLRSKNLMNTEQLLNTNDNFGHDLAALIRHCNIPNWGNKMPCEQLGKDRFYLKHLHEYLRYHATIPMSVVKEQVDFLNQIIVALKKCGL